MGTARGARRARAHSRRKLGELAPLRVRSLRSRGQTGPGPFTSKATTSEASTRATRAPGGASPPHPRAAERPRTLNA